MTVLRCAKMEVGPNTPMIANLQSTRLLRGCASAIDDGGGFKLLRKALQRVGKYASEVVLCESM